MELTLNLILYLLRSFQPAVIQRAPFTPCITGIKCLIPDDQNLSPRILYLANLSDLYAPPQPAASSACSAPSAKALTILLVPPAVPAPGFSDDLTDALDPSYRSCTLLTVRKPASAALLLNTLLESFHRITAWDKQMHVGALEGETPQSLLDMSEDLLRCPVMLFDPGFRVLAYSRKYSTDNPGFQAAAKSGYTSPDTMALTRELHILSRLEKVEQGKSLIAPAVEDPNTNNIYHCLFDGSRLLCYICIFCGSQVPSSGYQDLLQIFFTNMTYCLQRNYSSERYGQMLYETILLRLMHPETVTGEWLTDRIASVPGLEENGNYVLEVLQFDDAANLSPDYLIRHIQITVPELKPFLYENHICLLLSFPKGTRITDEQIQKRCLHLQQILTRYHYRIGCSIPFQAIRDIRYAYRQAISVLSFTPSTDSRDPADTERICFFSGHIYDYLCAAAEQYAAAPFRIPVRLLQCGLYRSLKEQDAANHTHDLLTVMTYLYCDCNATRTARQLYVHRNTVRNIITRTEKRWQTDLSDPNIRQQLILSDQMEHYLLVQSAQADAENHQ